MPVANTEDSELSGASSSSDDAVKYKNGETLKRKREPGRTHTANAEKIAAPLKHSQSRVAASKIDRGVSGAATPANYSASRSQNGGDFASLGVHPWLVSSLKAMAITRPTQIQRACIPQLLSGKDCIGGSRTGSGKTVAFAVPMLQKWAEDPFGIFAVVLTPTR